MNSSLTAASNGSRLPVRRQRHKINSNLRLLFKGTAMTDLIEDQIHRYFIEQEEKRCTLLESEQRKVGNHKKVTRRVIKKPWTRPGNAALCQESELLMLVSDYSYDLADERFQEYCVKRGLIHVAGEHHSPRWHLMADYRSTKPEFLSNKHFQRAQEAEGTRHEFTPQEMEIHWQIVLLGRAKLQDCWELYRAANGHAT